MDGLLGSTPGVLGILEESLRWPCCDDPCPLGGADVKLLLEKRHFVTFKRFVRRTINVQWKRDCGHLGR